MDLRRNYLFGRTGNSRWQNGAFSIRRIREVVSLSQHWVIPSKLRSTNSHDYGPASLYCCFEWPVRSGSHVRDEASRERSSRRYGGWMLLWIYTHDRTFPDSIAIAVSWRRVSIFLQDPILNSLRF